MRVMCRRGIRGTKEESMSRGILLLPRHLLLLDLICISFLNSQVSTLYGCYLFLTMLRPLKVGGGAPAWNSQWGEAQYIKNGFLNNN